MGRTAYTTTGAIIHGLRTLLGVNIRVTGTENLVCRPTLFVANHFTRMETFLIPYVIQLYAGRQVRSLGTHSVFKGVFGRYFESLGGMSTRHPRRNRTIVRELMTWKHDWVIYPEGGLIKNKRVVDRGRFRLDHPERSGPPHTGAAMLALKAEMSKRRYLDACDRDELRRIEFYEESLGISGPEEICSKGIVMVPVTTTFYPMRPSRNVFNRLAKIFIRDLDPRVDEELQVEGSLLLKGSDVGIHFGEPIEVGDYLGRVAALARKVIGLFSEQSRTDLFLRQQAKRLTDACMHSIYQNIEISFDHLFCYGLRAYNGDRIAVEDLRSALFLAAHDLRKSNGLRLHPSLRNGVTGLVTGEVYDPWDVAVQLAEKEGSLVSEGDHYVINHDALAARHEFHTIRLENMMQVIANEIEPVKSAVDTIRRCINLSGSRLREQTSEVLQDKEVEVFERDYAEAFHPQESKAKDLGEPFYLKIRGAKTGVVLVHGYLASPQQVRRLADHLHGQGLNVYGVRLPGHGTAPGQMIEVRWQEWLGAVARGMALMRQDCESVVVGGFSLGGALALLLAARRADGAAGVFSINAPIKLRDRRAALVDPIVRWNGVMRYFGFMDHHYRITNDGTESPDINYGFDYLKGIREVRRATHACRKRLEEVTIPALIIQADGDPLVDPEAGRMILSRLGCEEKILTTLSFDRHLIVRGEGSETVFEAVARFIGRVSPGALV